MDRFIVKNIPAMVWDFVSLKSNMDRFIDPNHWFYQEWVLSLKSNMDRFIEVRYLQKHLFL